MDVTQAREHWEAEVDGFLSAYARVLVAQGRAEWVADPWFDGVFGLLWAGTNKAMVIIYVDDHPGGGSIDFEEDDDFAAAAYAMAEARS